MLSCEIPQIPNGKGTSDADVVQVRMLVSFECDPEFNLIGQNQLQCIVGNSNVTEWDIQLPECQKGRQIKQGRDFIKQIQHSSHREN